MDNTLKLRVMFDMVDNMTKPLQMMLTGNKGLADSLKETRRELEDMAKTQKRIGEFREMRKGLANTASDLAAARARVDTLAQSLRATRSPSREMISDFNKAQRAAENLSSAHSYQAGRVQALRTQLAGAGIDTRNLTRDERNLRTTMASRTSIMNASVRQFEEDQRAKNEVWQKKASKYWGHGKAIKDAGMRVVDKLPGLVGEAKDAETAILRLRLAGASDDAVKFARELKIPGRSATDNLNLTYELQKELDNEQLVKIALPTLSKLKSANAALFGEDEAKANDESMMSLLKVFKLRDGMNTEAAFIAEASAAQKMILAGGGKISGDDWNTFAESGGAAAKQLRADVFYAQMAPIVEKMGADAAGKGLAAVYDSASQGKMSGRAAQRLGLVDPKGVRANGGITPDALAGSNTLKTSPVEWLEKVLLPKLDMKGINTPDMVKAAIKQLFPDQDARTWLTTAYEQRQQIDESAQRSARVPGVDGIQALAMQSTTGREQTADSQMRNLKLEVGELFKPAYNALLDIKATATEKAVKFTQEHSTTAGILAAAYAVLSGGLPGGGSLGSALATSRAGSMAVSGSRLLLGAGGRALTNPYVLGTLIVGGAAGYYAWNHPDKLNGAGGWLRKQFGKEASNAPADSATSGAAGNQGGMTHKFAALATAATSLLVPSAYAESLPPSAFAANPASIASSPGPRINTPVDNRPPVTAPAFAAASAAPAPAPITINITPPPGVNAAELARLVRVEVERYYREQASRTSSRLSD
ncbi:hypothetical protein WL76_17625 [Burkholderia ubonensis]|uniref:hypothetical protein n=1 Tax=Burkholderia ubonensis TaxID=101571 RepID=UPI00075377AA|nr:hypothetical protein [Burkholderia ubonensis]KWE51736.1 hypothetical protein WL76_17625 [Burkholderia ubonensis]